MPAPVCTRPGCDSTLPPGRIKYCSQQCAKIAHQEQLVALSARRKESRKQQPKPKCEILGCSNTFTRTSSSHKYCSDACALKGLQAAIDRQRERREQAKKMKAIEKAKSKG